MEWRSQNKSMDNVKSLKTCVLASGSKGNCTLIESENTKILIDIGKSCAYITSLLKDLNIEPTEINGVLITHTHNDHTSGLKVFVKRYHPKIYLTSKMYEDIKDHVFLEDCIFINQPFRINDLNIDYIKTSHDVSDSNGYIIKKDSKSLVYITDTGYINEKNTSKLKNHNIYIMESNHDVKMLMTGKYPYHLKQRVQGDRGHLSNDDSSKYLSNYIGPNTEYIILAHLSEDNNTKKLAYDTLLNNLSKHNKKINKIIIAEQDNKTELIAV